MASPVSVYNSNALDTRISSAYVGLYFSVDMHYMSCKMPMRNEIIVSAVIHIHLSYINCFLVLLILLLQEHQARLRNTPWTGCQSITGYSHTLIHRCNLVFRVSSQLNVHVFGLWEKTPTHTGRTWKLHLRRASTCI